MPSSAVTFADRHGWGKADPDACAESTIWFVAREGTKDVGRDTTVVGLGQERPLATIMRALASSGWPPAVFVGVLAIVVLSAYDTPLLQTVVFAAYVSLGIAVPGLLVVRWLRGRPAHIAEDLTLGLTAGYTIEIVTYIVARGLGVPLLVLVWPVLTMSLFALVPSLRRHWRGSGERAPVWWSWALAIALGYLLLATAASYFAQQHLTGADTPYVDMPYHLALIGELRNHVPPEIPWVAGVPLSYHWFYYAEAAATSWATGIEPVTLLYRLSGLPMFVAFVVLTASAARRLAPVWWTGPVAVAIAMFGTVAGPYRWVGPLFPVFDTQTLLQTSISPTNLFGLALLAALIVVLLDLIGSAAGSRTRDWALAGLLILGIAGAKATLLPLLIVGLACVVVGTALVARRVHRPALIGLAVTVVALVLATAIIYRGATGGVIVGVRGLQQFPVAVAVAAGRARGLGALAIPVAIIVVAVALWSFLWAGAVGLLGRWRATLATPGILLLIGICVAGLGAATFLLYPGLSELYYLRGAVGAFGILTATGIHAILPGRFRRGALIAAASVAILIGVGTVTAIRAFTPTTPLKVGSNSLSAVIASMLLPVLVLAAVASVTVLVARGARMRQHLGASAGAFLVVAVVMGFGLANSARALAAPFDARATAAIVGGVSNLSIPRDGIDAARWLRDHSDPADLVATNLHCLTVQRADGSCDSRHFWVSAYAERRMLVEGWSYTNGAQGSESGAAAALGVIPTFWDPTMLATNDAAFSDPTSKTVAALRDAYHVRWLFADLSKADGPGLDRSADLRFRTGDFAVYQVS